MLSRPPVLILFGHRALHIHVPSLSMDAGDSCLWISELHYGDCACFFDEEWSGGSVARTRMCRGGKTGLCIILT